MTKKKLDYYAGDFLAALVESCSGSIEEALDNAGIYGQEERQEIKDWFGWEDEYENE